MLSFEGKARYQDLHRAFSSSPEQLIQDLHAYDVQDTIDRQYEEDSTFGDNLPEIIQKASAHFRECFPCFEEYPMHVRMYALGQSISTLRVLRRLGIQNAEEDFKKRYGLTIRSYDYLNLLEDMVPGKPFYTTYLSYLINDRIQRRWKHQAARPS